jgi:hypothetical protein
MPIELEDFEKYNNHYEFVYDEYYQNLDTLPIRLTGAPYDDIMIRYQNVSFDEKNKHGDITMNFSYDIVENPKDIDIGDEKTFQDYLGDILVNVMITMLNEKEKYETRDIDSNPVNSK